jgi:hypothetical protein
LLGVLAVTDSISVPETKKRVRPVRTDKIRQQDAKRQAEATKRKQEREKALGMRVFSGEIYRKTDEDLAALVAATGCEEIEVVANMISRLRELQSRDPHAFDVLTSHKPLPEVWHG